MRLDLLVLVLAFSYICASTLGGISKVERSVGEPADNSTCENPPECIHGDLNQTTCDCTCEPGRTNPLCDEYDYELVLKKSLLFYETQRSGHLPNNNRIPYRGDSATSDVDNDGNNMTGGYYDAGDHMKVTSTIAFSMTLISWGLIHFTESYKNPGYYNRALDCIKWGTDYLLKTLTKDLVVVIGNNTQDHSYWGRPEDMTMARPACHASPADKPTSEAMLTSAALSAASIVFKNKDPAYSDELLLAAKSVYNMYRSSLGFFNHLCEGGYT
uniref:cellulase n=1 Tax=Saccoglossus kowalevskii TaxID=10224 RepID=A0ABM0MKJ1_SACKO|nr:PREDICTED: endoglucanase 22-like [Saccoglossus kowalevskii]